MNKQFQKFFSEFKTTQHWRGMQNTREDSPWHREENVAVHTQMLIDWYCENRHDLRTPKQQVQTLVACLFHDVGKPIAEIQKFSEERGNYRAYHGHEQVSARQWINYALSPENFQSVRDVLGFNETDIANIALMLEHHVPFSLVNKIKRQALKSAFLHRMGEHGHQAWIDLLLSDQHGRISDNKQHNLDNVYKWIEEWNAV